MQIDWFLALRSSVWSFLLHLVVAGLLIFSFEFTPNQLVPPKQVNIIQAVSIDKAQIEQELKQLQDNEKKKRAKEKKRQTELEKKTADEKQKGAVAKKKRLTEERKLAALNKEKERAREKRVLEQKRITQLEKEKKDLEGKRKLEEKKKHKVEEEKKRLEEEHKKKEAELKRIEEEKKRKAEVERKKKELEQTLQNELAEEQKEQETRQRGRDQSNIARYTDLITEKIQQNFNELGLPQGLSCVLLIRMIPGGDVAEATIVKSSGDEIFDRRAKNAVYAASPLPVPDENRLFELMRNLRITFEP